jgi:hypothetical protein
MTNKVTHTICPECNTCFTPDAHDILIKRLVADNDRLRMSLMKIIHKCDLCDKGFESFPCSCGKYGTTEEIVRDALEGK